MVCSYRSQVDATLQFTIGDVFTGSNTGGKIQAAEDIEVCISVAHTDGGSGYVTPPVVTISGGNTRAGCYLSKHLVKLQTGLLFW